MNTDVNYGFSLIVFQLELRIRYLRESACILFLLFKKFLYLCASVVNIAHFISSQNF